MSQHKSQRESVHIILIIYHNNFKLTLIFTHKLQLNFYWNIISIFYYFGSENDFFFSTFINSYENKKPIIMYQIVYKGMMSDNL